MNHREVGRYWDGNADAWTALSRQGYDTYRDHLNTPWFLDLLPNVKGLHGLDIGCGEGTNTQQVAERGAKLTALDISPRFVGHARRTEREGPRGVRYLIASAVELPFSDESFDFAVACMSLMDIAETERVLSEAYRVIRPGGFLQFSITHPCYDTPHRRQLRDPETRLAYAVELGGYFESHFERVEEWSFGAAPAEVRAGWDKFKVPRFHRTLSSWLNLVIQTGFTLERLAEPMPDDETVARVPSIQDTQVTPYFLQVLCRKPA